MAILLSSLLLVLALSVVVYLPCIIIARVSGPLFPWLQADDSEVSS